MNNRRGELRKYMYGLVIFAGVTTGILSFSAGMFDTYSTGMETSEEYQKFQDLGDTVNQNVTTQIRQGREQTGLIGSAIQAGVFVLGPIWQIVQMVVATFTLYPAIVSTFIGIGGFPAWVENLAVGIISIGILFGIVTVYRGVKA